MTTPDDILSGLRGRVLDLPDPKFLEIVGLLERVGDHPRVRETMGAMRARLVHMRPPRRLNLRRIFCDPFEDLLDSPTSLALPIKRLDRSIIEPIWRLVEARLGDATLDPLRRTAAKLSDGDFVERHTLGCRLWPLAAKALRAIAEEIQADPRCEPRRVLGAFDDPAARVNEIADFLDVGHPITEAKALISPKPAEFEDETATALAHLVQDAARHAPERALNLLLVAGSRLRRPADMVAALSGMDFGPARRERSRIFAALSGMIVDSLETGGARSGARDLDPAKATDLARRLLDGLSSARDLMDAVSEREFDPRLESVRGTIRDLVRRKVIDAVPGALIASLPAIDEGTGGTAPIDEAAWETAEENAVALRRCRDLAPELDLDAALDDATVALTGALSERVAAFTEALVASGDEAAESGLSFGLRLIEILEGPGVGSEARERALAALLGDLDPEVDE